MKKRLLSLLLVLPFILRGQPNPQLAEQYFQNGEFEKSAVLYEKIYAKETGDFYFDRYLACLMELNKFDEAEKIITKQIKHAK